jgi:hypothetical protein
LKKFSIRSKRLIRASWLASTSLAAYDRLHESPQHWVKEDALTKRRTPIPEKMTEAGENTCEIGDKG